jgi:guanyl-specific ribonuclease Sa
MSKMNLHKSLAAKSLLSVIALLMVTEPAWAILGVWRRTAVTVAVVSSAESQKAAAATANAAAANNAAAAAAAQQSAAASAASAQKAAASAAHPQKTPQQKLQELQSLYDQKLISESEYQASKQKILNEMTQ